MRIVENKRFYLPASFFIVIFFQENENRLERPAGN